MTKRTIGFVLGTVLAVSLVGAVFQDAPDLFQKALRMERSEGDLKGAIALYERVVAAAADEALAAKAQLRIGFCYEALGLEQAAEAFQSVIDRYPGQPEAVKVARDKIASLLLLRAGQNMAPQGFHLEKIWAGFNVDVLGGPSPDGKYLSYLDYETGDIGIRDIRTGQNRRVTQNSVESYREGNMAWESIWSPDSRTLAYNWSILKDRSSEIRLIDIIGDEPRILMKEKPELKIVTLCGWHKDGEKILLAFRDSEQHLGIGWLYVKEGRFEPIQKIGNFHPFGIHLSPDGKYILLLKFNMESMSQEEIHIMPSAGGRIKPLVADEFSNFIMGWVPGAEWFLYISNRSGNMDLWALKVQDGEVMGGPVLIKSNMGQIMPVGLSQDGSFYYYVNNNRQDIYVSDFDARNGKLLSSPEIISQRFSGANSNPSWSPDGNLLAYRTGRETSRFADSQSKLLALYNIESGHLKEYPTDFVMTRYLQGWWAADGSRFYTQGIIEGRSYGVFSIDPKSGDTQTLAKKVDGLTAGLADGKNVLFRTRRRRDKISNEIFVRNLETGEDRLLFRPETPSMILMLAVSSGTDVIGFVVVESAPSYKSQLMVGSVSEGAFKAVYEKKDPMAGISMADISHDGKMVYFLMGKQVNEDMIQELWRVNTEGGEPEKIDIPIQGIRHLSVHPSGEKIAFSAQLDGESEIWRMRNYLPQDKR